MDEFRATIDHILDKILFNFYEEVPKACHIRDSKNIEESYFIRHTIETVLRIRLARIADAKLLCTLTKEDPVAAKLWCEYAADEMLHDRMFLEDLRRINPNAVLSVYENEPFRSTKLLQGYLYYTIEHVGPLGLLSKSYFLEYLSAKTQYSWVDNAEKSFGPKSQKGARAHLGVDATEDHAKGVWDVIGRFLKGTDDEKEVIEHMHMYGILFRSYFEELASTTQSDGFSGARSDDYAISQSISMSTQVG